MSDGMKHRGAMAWLPADDGVEDPQTHHQLVVVCCLGPSRSISRTHTVSLLSDMTATLSCACGWLQGILLTDSERLNSMSLLACMSAIAICLLLPMTMILEPGATSRALDLASQHSCMPPFTHLLFVPLLSSNVCQTL